MARYGERRFWDLSPSALLFGIATPKSKTHFKQTNKELLSQKRSVANMWLVVADPDVTGNGESGEDKLEIQTVPMNLEIDATTKWAVIPSMGRNNPFYHFTGSEQSLSFTLDWYANNESRQDVISKCRWVESLTKADGYISEPKSIILIFGDLFKYERWIVESAPYKLELFDREFGMMPRQAYQDITLKRVTSYNMTTNDIRIIPNNIPLNTI